MATRYHWMADTSEAAFQELIEAQRRMSPGEKLARVFELTHEMILEGRQRVREQYPGADEREVFLREAASRLGWATVKKVYGWAPEDEA